MMSQVNLAGAEDLMTEEALSGNTTEGSDEGTLDIQVPNEGIVIEKNDRSLYELYRWYQSGRLILDPDWQRSFIWNEGRASRLIESFLIDIPVPVVYLAKKVDGKYEVIDGVQRLTSAFKFFGGDYSLSGLEMRKELEKMRFSQLPKTLQDKLQDSTLRTFELSPQTPTDLLFTIFNRLNTGGVALNEMEIRNCIYRGPLIELIKKLATNEDFLRSLNQSHLDKRMVDRSLVLRFLAFYEKSYLKANTNLKGFLNSFCDDFRFARQEKIEEWEKQFKRAMRAVLTVFGDQAYRLRRTDDKGNSEWKVRANASIFQTISVSFTAYDLPQITQYADAILEEYLDMIATDEHWIDCVSSSTGSPIRMQYVFKSWFDRLETVMRSAGVASIGARIFSASLKKEMWQQDPTCAICGQEIKLLNDAAMDHDLHYWRGGKTIPSNARLVHRLCNLKRTH